MHSKLQRHPSSSEVEMGGTTPPDHCLKGKHKTSQSSQVSQSVKSSQVKSKSRRGSSAVVVAAMRGEERTRVVYGDGNDDDNGQQ